MAVRQCDPGVPSGVPGVSGDRRVATRASSEPKANSHSRARVSKYAKA